MDKSELIPIGIIGAVLAIILLPKATGTSGATISTSLSIGATPVKLATTTTPTETIVTNPYSTPYY